MALDPIAIVHIQTSFTMYTECPKRVRTVCVATVEEL